MAMIEISSADGVATLVLNDVDRRNAISSALADELVAAVRAATDARDTRSIIITGAGTAFCAGAVLDDLRNADDHGLRDIYRAFTVVRDCPLPTIAAVNGPAVGAGVNLALACDVRLAARSARFDTRFLRLGLHPGGGHGWMMSRAVGYQAAAAMTLFGQAVDGEHAERIGLVWRCTSDDRLLGEAHEVSRHLANAPRDLAVLIKQSLASARTTEDPSVALEQELRAQLWSIESGSFAPGLVR